MRFFKDCNGTLIYELTLRHNWEKEHKCSFNFSKFNRFMRGWLDFGSISELTIDELTEKEKSVMVNKINFLIWASLQDNNHRSDIIDRCRDAQHARLVKANYDRTYADVVEMRKDLKALKA